MGDVRHNETLHRFELDADGETAIAVYRPGPSPNTITIVHTEVPSRLEGRGIGSQLVRGALEQVRSMGLKVVPQCPFVAAYMARHPETHDLMA